MKISIKVASAGVPLIHQNWAVHTQLPELQGEVRTSYHLTYLNWLRIIVFNFRIRLVETWKFLISCLGYKFSENALHPNEIITIIT